MEVDRKDVRLKIDKSSDFYKQIQMVHLKQEDLIQLRRLKPLVENNIQGIVNQFYKNLEHESSLMDIIEDNSSIERLKQTLTVHIQEMFNGQIDDAFLEKRLKIANIHFRIGLEPKWYMCAFQDLLFSLMKLINNHTESKEDFYLAIDATRKY